MTLNLDFLSRYFTEVHFDKDALITRAGEVEHSLYYLSEGIVRFFYYNPTTDKETTVDILFAEQFFYVVCLVCKARTLALLYSSTQKRLLPIK